MATGTETQEPAEPTSVDTASLQKRSPWRRHWLYRRAPRGVRRFFNFYVFSSLTRRIVVLNLAALAALVSGILYLNQFRAGLIDARLESLLTQSEIIAGAITENTHTGSNQAPFDPDRLLQLEAGEAVTSFEDQLKALEFSVNPEHIAPILQRVISPTRTRALVYDADGRLLVDSQSLFLGSDFLRFGRRLAPPPPRPNYFQRLWQRIMLAMRRGDLPLYKEAHLENGKHFEEVGKALGGSRQTKVRVTKNGELIVAAAVPIRRFKTILGALMLTTKAGDIDAIISAERIGIFRVFLVAAAVTLVLSILLAGTIAGPVRRLAAAAERVRKGVKTRAEIPGFGDRQDEIGHLARTLRGMTNALYDRIAAIERFAADVSHELKNPLTSLRSAVETLPLVKNDKDKTRLLEVIEHDVRRLDRLISDISDASRIDAELQREDTADVDIGELLQTITRLSNETGRDEAARIHLAHISGSANSSPIVVSGHDSRLSQVMINLIDNARSFSPPESTITIAVRTEAGTVEILVEDEGSGIDSENFERIFGRFYTDRPEGEAFGNHSGLGLSISRQIIAAHDGTIRAENRLHPDTGRVLGARFIVTLPLA